MINLDRDGKFSKNNILWNKGKRKYVNINYCIEKYKEGYSCMDISKKFNVSEKTIHNRLKEAEIELRKINKPSKITKEKIRKTLKEKYNNPDSPNGLTAWNKGKKGNIPWNKGKRGVQVAWNKGRKTGQQNWKKRTFTEETIKKIKASRAKQIFPKKDSSIEVKVRNFLEKLKIEYFQHKYMNILHGYQCDFFIPELNMVLECDGVYWHRYPTGRDIDHVRTGELLQKGFKVLRLWEFEINEMSIQEFKKRVYDKK